MVQGEEDAEDKRQVTLDREKLRGEEEGKSDLNAQLCIFSPPLSFRHRKKTRFSSVDKSKNDAKKRISSIFQTVSSTSSHRCSCVMDHEPMNE